MIFDAKRAYEETKVDPARSEMCSKAALTPSGYFAGKAAKRELKHAVKEARKLQKLGDRCGIIHWDAPFGSNVPDWDYFQAIMLRRGFIVDFLDLVHEDEINFHDKKTKRDVVVKGLRRTYRIKW